MKKVRNSEQENRKVRTFRGLIQKEKTRGVTAEGSFHRRMIEGRPGDGNTGRISTAVHLFRKIRIVCRPEARVERIRLVRVEISKLRHQRDHFFRSVTKEEARITVVWRYLKPMGSW